MRSARAVSPAAYKAFRREVASVLETLGVRRPWFIKEPRLCLLVREILPILTRPVFVHVVRDPIEVADSLAARDGITRDRALALWEHYTRAAFGATRGWRRVMIDYADLVADPYGTAVRLQADLIALGIEGLAVPDAALVGAWIEPGLRRQRATAEAHATLGSGQRELHSAIADRSILEREFVEESAHAFDLATAEAASLRRAG